MPDLMRSIQAVAPPQLPPRRFRYDRSAGAEQAATPLLRRGKVREVYEVDDSTLLLVASDRVSPSTS